MRVGVLGALNVDIVVHGSAPHNLGELRGWVGPSEITCLTAGSVGYFAQNLAKMGCNVHLVSTIADDTHGKSIISSLQSAGIDTDQINVEPRTESGIGVYLLIFGASKRPMTYKLPTHHAWPPHLAPENIGYLLDTDLVHCGGYLHFPDLWNKDVPSLFAKAQKNGLITSLDPQFPLSPLESAWIEVLKPILVHTDVLFLDEYEALGVVRAEGFDQAIGKLKRIGVDEVVIKLGERGCLLLNKGAELYQPAVKPAKFVDSIGAGDSFDVGFLYGILKGFTPEKSAKLAVYVASKSIEGPGGTIAFPRISDIEIRDWEREVT
ncbi:MAG: PfkB family carbohydrate kinase [Promethearchaeati archaeon SRVP18_Atabeyarchaeia-1]